MLNVSKVSQLIIPSVGKWILLLEISSKLSMIWSYPVQDSYTSVVSVSANVIINKDSVFKRLSKEMFFKITCKCCVDGNTFLCAEFVFSM